MTGNELTRFVRYAHDGEVHYGCLDGETVHQLEAAPYAATRKTGLTLPLVSVRILAPCEPSKIIGVGLNYRSHLHGRPAPQWPGLFAKLSSAVIAPEATIVIPADAEAVHFEGELVAVIGRETKNVTPAEAAASLFGLTGGNDVSERNWQKNDLQWLRAKGADTFAPLGPCIVRGLDPSDLSIETRVNGAVRQSARTRDLLFDVRTLISYASRYFTLLPGDVIFTGTPGETGGLQPGDEVEVEIEGIGVLRNPVSGA